MSPEWSLGNDDAGQEGGHVDGVHPGAPSVGAADLPRRARRVPAQSDLRRGPTNPTATAPAMSATTFSGRATSCCQVMRVTLYPRA